MSWKSKTLGELADVQLGKMLDQKKNQGEYRRYLGNDNVHWNQFKLDEVKEMRIKESERERYGLRPSDLLICEGGDPGRCALWTSNEEMYYQKALNRVRVCNEIDPRLLLYYLLHIGTTREIAQYYTGGATIKHLPNAALKRVEIRYPSLDEQRRIASILMAYDNLIENNRRQIALLEEAAQRLYKEWFVDLRFPGYKNADMVDDVPKGWQKLRLSDCIEKEIGGGWGQEYGSHEFSEEGYVIRATDMTDVEGGDISSVPLRWHKLSNISPRALEAGDIVFEVSGGGREHGVGRSMLVTQEELGAFGKPVICASFCKRIKPKRNMPLLIAECLAYEYRTEGLRKFEKRSAGNIINYHWKTFLSEYEVLVPDEATLASFEKYVSSLRNRKSIASQSIRAAREARDRLLPKLMSGEILG